MLERELALNVALLSSGFFIFKMVLMLLFGLDDEFESEGIFSIISINKVLSFFMGYGFSEHYWNNWLLSFVIGVGFVLFYHFIMKQVKKFSTPDEIIQPRLNVGDVVETYTSINPHRGQVMLKGKVFEARSLGPKIGIYETVRVKEIKGETYFVEQL